MGVDVMRTNRLTRRWGWGWIVVLVLAGIAGVLALSQAVGPGREYREQAFRVMRGELAALPPYAGSTQSSSLVRDAPFHIPSIELGYTLVGSCGDAEAYYHTLAANNGWLVTIPIRTLHDPSDPPSDTSRDNLDSEYSKTVGSYHLAFTVDCFVDQSFQPGYGLIMTAQ